MCVCAQNVYYFWLSVYAIRINRFEHMLMPADMKIKISHTINSFELQNLQQWYSLWVSERDALSSFDNANTMLLWYFRMLHVCYVMLYTVGIHKGRSREIERMKSRKKNDEFKVKTNRNSFAIGLMGYMWQTGRQTDSQLGKFQLYTHIDMKLNQ